MTIPRLPANAAEVGETVASVPDYAAAQKLVSKLIGAEVPARDIAIVGIGVRTIEKVTGKLGYAAAAKSGAINGILIGLFLAAIFVLTTPEAPIQLFVGFVAIGIAIGMLMSIVTYSIVRRRRDFASVMQLASDRYEVTVLPASLAKARQVVGRPAAPPAPVNLDEPPRYGERIVPSPAPNLAPASEVPAPPPAPEQPAAPREPEAQHDSDPDDGATRA